MIEKFPKSRIPQAMIEMLTIFKIEISEPLEGEIKVMEIKINTFGLMKLINRKYNGFKKKFKTEDKYVKLIFDKLDHFLQQELGLIGEKNLNSKDYFIVFAFDKGGKYLKESLENYLDFIPKEILNYFKQIRYNFR